MTRRHHVRRSLVALSALALLVVSGCGDDDDDEGSGGSGGASGDPIKVMTWTSLENPQYSAPQVKAAAEAKVKAINDAGGIGGRPVALEFCDSNFDPNTEAACARQAVEEGFAAVVGSTTFFPNTLPLLERAGVAYIGGQGITPAELKSPISFPLAGSIPGWFQGAAALAVEKGVQRPAIVVSEVGASQFAGQQFQAALSLAGVQPVRTVTAPLGAPDQAASAAQAADGTDAVLIGAAPNDSVKIIQALRQANYQGVIASAGAIVGDSLGALGEAGNGLQVTSLGTPTGQTHNPAIAAFVKEMDAVDPSASKDERSLVCWASHDLFAKLAARLDGDVTAKTVLDAMNDLSEPIETGVTEPYSVSGRTSPLPDYPRIFNATVVFAEVQNGEIVQTREGFVNPFEVLEQVAGR